MARRFVSIWFSHLKTDWFSLGKPHLRNLPFVLRSPSHGRMIITAANPPAQISGVEPGMALADVRAIIPELEVVDDIPELPNKLLHRLAEWCIRFTPIVSIDPPDGLFFDATGCAHLWGGEHPYLLAIINKLKNRGYHVKAAMADTPGVAWAAARYGKEPFIIGSGKQMEALQSLPPEALRLESEISERLHKLGLHQIRQFINMPRSSLRRRFGVQIIHQLDLALGRIEESLVAVHPPEPYQERLNCIEPVQTARAIEIAIEELLTLLCKRLHSEQLGLRRAVLKCHRVDGKVVQIEIGTNRPTHNVRHLFKLFELKLSSIEPGLGIELFILEAPNVQTHLPYQEKMWETSTGLADVRLSELVDRLAGKIGFDSVKRFIPAEHYWPERSFKLATSLQEKAMIDWKTDRQRPLYLLPHPQKIEVTAPIPDYPPMLFRYKGRVHNIVKADGPERIEQEWWLQQGRHRDYYRVEDEEGRRYWLYRSGHYHDKTYQWFLHGFFP